MTNKLIIGVGVLAAAALAFFFGGEAKADPLPDPPGPPPPGGDPQCVNAAALAEGWTVTRIQKALNSIGISVGGADGICGPNTKKGISTFQKGSALPVLGYVDVATAIALDAASKAKGAKVTNAADFNLGCKHGGEDAHISLKAGEILSRGYSDKSEEYASGYRTCFLQTIKLNGGTLNHDGTLVTPSGDDPYEETWIMGDSI